MLIGTTIPMHENTSKTPASVLHRSGIFVYGHIHHTYADAVFQFATYICR